MAQGLQCWDASGNLIVDLGDYNIRFVENKSVTCSGSAISWTFPYSGMTENEWLVVTPYDNTGVISSYVCIPYNGGFYIRYLWTTHSSSDTFTVGIYRFG